MWATIFLTFTNDKKAVLTYSGEDLSGVTAIVTCENGRYEVIFKKTFQNKSLDTRLF